MAKSRRTLDGKQRLAPLIAKLKGRGVKLTDEAGGLFSKIFGLAASAFGILLLISAGLIWLEPEAAKAVVVCRGTPADNAIAGAFIMTGGLLILLLFGRLPQTILVTDSGLVLGYRSGRERKVAWHEIDCYFDFYGNIRILKLRSGGIVPLRYPDWPAWHDIRLLISVRQWSGPALSFDNPTMSQAFERFKLLLVGPGIDVPIDQGLRHWRVQKKIIIYTIACFAVLFFSLLGWLNDLGPLLGVTPIAIAGLVDIILKTNTVAEDNITVRMTRLDVAGRHTAPLTIAYEQTRYWRSNGFELSISFMEKRDPVVVAIMPDDANMLIEAARTASQLTPLGAVVSGRESATAA